MAKQWALNFRCEVVVTIVTDDALRENYSFTSKDSGITCSTLTDELLVSALQKIHRVIYRAKKRLNWRQSEFS
jgi:hypothetical protein